MFGWWLMNGFTPESAPRLLFVRGSPRVRALGPVPLFAPIETGPFSFVLADKLAYCRISYQERRPGPELSRWVPRWLHTNAWPVAIRFEMQPLVASSSTLDLSTITVPLHVTRDPYQEYRE